MYITINGKFFDKNRLKAKEANIAYQGEEDQKNNDELTFESVENEVIDNLEIDEDNISVTVTNELGTFSIDIPLNTETLEDIISVTVKKMNKIKTVLEGLK